MSWQFAGVTHPAAYKPATDVWESYLFLDQAVDPAAVVVLVGPALWRHPSFHIILRRENLFTLLWVIERNRWGFRLRQSEPSRNEQTYEPPLTGLRGEGAATRSDAGSQRRNHISWHVSLPPHSMEILDERGEEPTDSEGSFRRSHPRIGHSALPRIDILPGLARHPGPCNAHQPGTPRTACMHPTHENPAWPADVRQRWALFARRWRCHWSWRP